MDLYEDEMYGPCVADEFVVLHAYENGDVHSTYGSHATLQEAVKHIEDHPPFILPRCGRSFLTLRAQRLSFPL